jgi:hypothetical protein
MFELKFSSYNYIFNFFNSIKNQPIQNEFIIQNKFYINKIDIKFIQFISSNKIFLSSISNIDDCFYYETVVLCDLKKENELIKKYNLPKDFFSSQLAIEKKLHKQFWKQIPYKNDWIYDVDDLYISDTMIPFDKNQNFIDIINSTMYEYNPIDWYLGWELKSYYYDELFFFL